MLRYGIAAFASAVLITLFIWQLFLPDVLFAWLLAINLVALLLYGHDKRLAREGRYRVPEKILLSVVLVGGTPGAFLGMHLFHHKTAKASFQLRFWIITLAQVALIAAYLVWIEPLVAHT